MRHVLDFPASGSTLVMMVSLGHPTGIWVYPRDDGFSGSPDKPPARAAVATAAAATTSSPRDTNSAVTPSEQRLVRELAFKVDVRAFDKKCLFPKCPVVIIPNSPSLVEAAHIIPRFILNIPKYRKSELYTTILNTAEFSRLDIDTPAMDYCSAATITRLSTIYVDLRPSDLTGKISYANSDTATQMGNIDGALDFSHRSLLGQQPPPPVWLSYNSNVFKDRGMFIRRAAKVAEAEPVKIR